jgi:hypothetical protein
MTYIGVKISFIVHIKCLILWNLKIQGENGEWLKYFLYTCECKSKYNGHTYITKWIFAGNFHIVMYTTGLFYKMFWMVFT